MTPDRNIVAGDLAITEIMWALDNAMKGTSAETNEQWIEIYNTLNVPIPADVANTLVLTFTAGRPINVIADVDPVVTNADCYPTSYGSCTWNNGAG